MVVARKFLMVALLSALGCKGSTPETPTPAANPPPPPPPPAPTPSAPAVQATGPRAEVSDPRFSLQFAIARPGPTDPARFTIELRGAGGYHVNDQYPIAADLTVENGTAEKTQLRRADAAEITQGLARFELPVRPSGEHPTVRGRLRFAVCTEAQCAFETRDFAVAL